MRNVDFDGGSVPGNDTCLGYSKVATHLTCGRSLREDESLHSYFPPLDARSVPGKAWQGVEVPFRNIHLLRTWCEKRRVQPVVVFQAAWALVLKCYTGDSHVVFSVDSVREHDILSNVDGADGLALGLRVDLEECKTSWDLINHVRTEAAVSFPAHPVSNGPGLHRSNGVVPTFPANTCLLYRESEKGIWPGPEGSRLQHHFDRDNNVRLCSGLENLC